MSYTYDYPHPAVTVDCAVFGFDESDLKVLLVQRALPPFEGHWALPGGFVGIDESINDAARRELEEETSLSTRFLEQLYTFGAVDRDPRERIISVAYYALVRLEDHNIKAASDARNAAWFSVSDLPKLAFDHDQILQTAHKRLQAKVRYQPIGFELLPPLFTMSQLQTLYEAILDRSLDRRNFRKKILKLGVVVETDKIEVDVSHRAARLFRFDAKAYEALIESGLSFDV